MEGKNFPTRYVSPWGIMLFYAQPPDLLHPLVKQFAQVALSVDFGLPISSMEAEPLTTFCDCREVASTTRAPRWQRVRMAARDRHSIDMYLQQTTDRWLLCTLESVQNEPRVSRMKINISRKRSYSVPREDVFQLFPICTTVANNPATNIFQARCMTTTRLIGEHSTKTMIGMKCRDESWSV